MANPKTLEQLYKEYGVKGKAMTTYRKVQNGEQSTSSAPGTRENPIEKKKSGLERLYEEYGVTIPKSSTSLSEEAKKSYSSAVNAKNKNVNIPSNMSDADRQARLTDIDKELRELQTRIQAHNTGMSRGGGYGSTSPLAQEYKGMKEKENALLEEKKNLERIGTFSQSEILDWEIADKEKELAKTGVPKVTSEAQGRMLASQISASPNGAEEFQNQMSTTVKLKSDIEALKRKKEMWEYADDTKDNSYNDNFGGQTSASYRMADIDIKTSDAWGKYLSNPTEENKEIALGWLGLSEEFKKKHKDALDDKNVQFGLLSQTGARYLPQLIDRLPAQAIGTLAGGVIGYWLGSPQIGASIGAAVTTGAVTFDQLKGSAYLVLLQAGVDEETARKNANDEAWVSSFIEGADAAWTVGSLGTGKAIQSLIKTGSKEAIKRIAKEAGKSKTKTVTKTLLSWLVKEPLQEYGEEYSQTGVSLANVKRSQRGETGVGNLLKETFGLIGDVLKGENPEAFEEMHSAGMEGAKTSWLYGGANLGSNIAMVNLVDNKSAANIGRSERDYAQHHIETALKQDENTTAYQMATKLSKKDYISDVELGKLVFVNELAEGETRLEKWRNDPDVVSSLVEEGKEHGGIAEKIANKIENKLKSGKSATVGDIERIVAVNNAYEMEKYKSQQKDVQDGLVQMFTGFRENGARAFSEIMDNSNEDFDMLKQEFTIAYEYGLTNPKTMPQDVKSNPIQRKAFEAGRLDYKLDLDEKVAMSQNTKIFGKESGYISNNTPSDVTKKEEKILDLLAKATDLKMGWKDELLGNAEIHDYKGIVLLNRDFERTDSKGNKLTIIDHALHEVGMHRVMELAPEEGRAFINALYQEITSGVSDEVMSPAQRKQARYAQDGIHLSTPNAMEEVAASSLYEKVYNRDADELYRALERIVNGTDQKAIEGVRVFKQILDNLIEKLKSFLNKVTGRELFELKSAINETTRLRDIYEKALSKSVNRVKEEKLTKDIENNGEKRISYSLSENARDDVHNVLNDKNFQGDVRLTDTTPSIMLSQKGVSNLPMLMKASHIRENVLTEDEARVKGLRVNKNINYHGLGESLFLNVIQDLDNVTEAYRGTKNAENPVRRENYFLLISKQTDVDGNTINVPVFINETGQYNRVFVETNKIATVFGKRELRKYINEQLRAKNLVRIKNRSVQISESTSPIKADYEMNASKESLSQSLKSVNTQFSLRDPEGNTLTDNLNPTSNSDIRYSLAEGNFTKDIENIDKVNTTEDGTFALKGENDIMADYENLKKINQALKEQFEVTKFAKTDKKSLEKFSKSLLKDYDSQADVETIHTMLDELYTYMANGEADFAPSYSVAYKMARDVAVKVIENSLVTDKSLYDEYKPLRDYLHTTRIKFDSNHDELPSGYESFNEFRKANMGRLLFANDGMSIDSVYQELSDMFPEFFNADKETNSADQLATIVNVLDNLKPTEFNPYSNEMSDVTNYLASDIMDRFFDLPQAKPTFADKAEKRVVQARSKGYKQAEKVRVKKDEKIEKLLASQREKTKKLIEKAKLSKKEAIAKEKQKRKESLAKMSEKQKVKVYRAKIMQHTSDLSRKLLRPSDNQHIPQNLQGVVAKLLESINLESNYTYDAESHSYKKNDEGLPTQRTVAFEELRKIYSKMASSLVIDPDLMGEDGLLSDVIALSDKRIADMTSSELETIWRTLRAIEATINTANKLFSSGKFAAISEVAEALKSDNAGKTSKKEYKYVGDLQRLATLDMLTPETYFHYLGDAGDSIFRMMRNAQDKHIRIIKEIADFTHKNLSNVDVSFLEKQIHTVKLGGEDVKLTTAQLMELYVLMKREQAVEHILIGGVLPDVFAEGIKKISKTEPERNISTGEISEALSILTDEQRAVADKMQEFVSTTLSEYGNEASMKVYNYEKFNEKNYWPIRTNKQDIVSDISKDTAVTTVANRGFTKSTKPHADTSVCIGSIFDTFSAHTCDMATYAAWLGASEDVNRIRNFVFWEEGVRKGTVKGILDTVHGTQGSKYLEKLLTDVAIGVKGTNNMNPFEKLIGHYKAAAVGSNLRVIIQQPTSILRALDVIDGKYLAEGIMNPLKGWEKAKRYAPIAQWKEWGLFDTHTGRQMKDVLFDNANFVERTKQIGMWGASMADGFAWGQLWNAVEAETRAKHKELETGSDVFYETVAKRFTEIVDHTQVVDGILQRSQIMRSDRDLSKMATAFMGESTKIYNMAMYAAFDARIQKGIAKKNAIKRLGRTGVALAVAGIINTSAQAIIDAMRDDDKEKKYWEKWLPAFGDNISDVVNPFGYVPFAKDIVSIFKGYDVKRMDAEVITKTFNAIKNMYKAINGEGKYTIAEALAVLFAEVGRLFGIPVSNAKRDIKSMVMTIAVETDSYLMQYRIEKAMLNVNYAGNSKNFMDILFNAYNNDKEAYEIIYKDLIKSGYDSEKIKNGMETRMMKAEGVKKSSELTKRYMSPDVEKKYDSSLRKVKTSQAWKSTNATQRKEAETDLYNFLTSASEDMIKTRAEARAFGVDEVEYTLWHLAKEMYDEKKDGLDAKEKAEVIDMLDLGNSELAYFYNTETSDIAFAYNANKSKDRQISIERLALYMAAIADIKGKGSSDKKRAYAKKYANNDAEYLLFLGKGMLDKNGDAQYDKLFGKYKKQKSD